MCLCARACPNASISSCIPIYFRSTRQGPVFGPLLCGHNSLPRPCWFPMAVPVLAVAVAWLLLPRLCGIGFRCSPKRFPLLPAPGTRNVKIWHRSFSLSLSLSLRSLSLPPSLMYILVRPLTAKMARDSTMSEPSTIHGRTASGLNRNGCCSMMSVYQSTA